MINHKHDILDIVNYFDKFFKRFQQHDAHEFLLHLLDILKLSYYYGKTKTNITNLTPTLCQHIKYCNPYYSFFQDKILAVIRIQFI